MGVVPKNAASRPIEVDIVAGLLRFDFGLSSGVCTNDLIRATNYIEGLDVGTVNIWEQPGYRIEMSPFGGIKDSGNGVMEGVLEAMKFFTQFHAYSMNTPSTSVAADGMMVASPGLIIDMVLCSLTTLTPIKILPFA